MYFQIFQGHPPGPLASVTRFSAYSAPPGTLHLCKSTTGAPQEWVFPWPGGPGGPRGNLDPPGRQRPREGQRRHERTSTQTDSNQGIGGESLQAPHAQERAKATHGGLDAPGVAFGGGGWAGHATVGARGSGISSLGITHRHRPGTVRQVLRVYGRVVAVDQGN